ncbi:protein of unknown function [Bacillus velezensis UCMB5033]|nr:protein of unknown function [Bacillus velezensis UCMB5113]CDG28209.1 protein of unknown function [Bacillus velezensis UCMB5033]
MQIHYLIILKTKLGVPVISKGEGPFLIRGVKGLHNKKTP